MATNNDAIKMLEQCLGDEKYSLGFQIACTIAIDAIREKADRDNPKPLSLDALQKYLASDSYDNLDPLYIDSSVPTSYAPKWSEAEKVARLLTGNANTYGKDWVAYRYRPKK